MRVLMLCTLLPLAVLVGCEVVDTVLDTNSTEEPLTNEEITEPVARAVDAAMPQIDPETGAVTWNFNPVLILSTLVGGVLALLQKRRAAKRKKIAAAMAKGIHDANVPIVTKRTIAANIRELATNAGVEASRAGVDALINGRGGLHDLVESLGAGVGRPK